MKGDDPALLSQAVRTLLAELLGDRPADLTIQEISEESDASVVLDASQTPPFLTDRRIVLVRHAGRFRADEVEPLLAYLSAPLETTVVVLVAGGGALPTRLVKAIRNGGHVVDAAAPGGKARQGWIAERLRKGPVALDRSAAALLQDRLGEELGQIDGVLDALAAAYGEGAKLGIDDLRPFLGTGGIAAPWELTDAIDGGDTETALAQLRRMLDGGGRHPLVVMATLQRHVGNLLRLDGRDVASEGEAAALLGVAPYPAKKALAQARRLGRPVIMRAMRLVAEADIELRGSSSWPGDMVLEVLVARLSRLAPARRSTTQRPFAK